MPPDFLLRCTRCGSEAVWDTEELPPIGAPEVGEPVLWMCERCGREMRHIIADLHVAVDKLHHEICLATELERATVDRVMDVLYRQRSYGFCVRTPPGGGPVAEVERVAALSGVPVELVEQIAEAEADWMRRRGYLGDRPREA